jgi:hypothetical protein
MWLQNDPVVTMMLRTNSVGNVSVPRGWLRRGVRGLKAPAPMLNQAGPPNMALVAARLKTAVAARQRITAGKSQTLVTPAFLASPTPPQEETVEEVAAEATAILLEALQNGAIARDSVRMVLGCHVAVLRALVAKSREDRALAKEAREPMPTAEREAWKREFMAEARAALADVVKVHRDGAKETVLAIRDEAGRLVRSADNGAAWRAGWLIVGSFVAGGLGGVALIWAFSL